MRTCTYPAVELEDGYHHFVLFYFSKYFLSVAAITCSLIEAGSSVELWEFSVRRVFRPPCPLQSEYLIHPQNQESHIHPRSTSQLPTPKRQAYPNDRPAVCSLDLQSQHLRFLRPGTGTFPIRHRVRNLPTAHSSRSNPIADLFEMFR